MKKLRIVAGSGDGITITDSHLGDTENFYIYDLFEDGSHEFIESRENPVKEMEHAGEDKMKYILQLLKDSDLMISRKKSPNFKRMAKNTEYQPVVVGVEDIEKALDLVGNSFQQVFDLVQRRKTGERFETIPVLNTET